MVLPVELGRVNTLVDGPVYFTPFATHFDAKIGRPSIPIETYLRLMFLTPRYRPGYESFAPGRHRILSPGSGFAGFRAAPGCRTRRHS